MTKGKEKEPFGKNIQYTKVRKPSERKTEKIKRQRIKISKEAKFKEQEIKRQNIEENEKLIHLYSFATRNGLKGKKAHHLMEILCQESILWSSYDSIRRNLGNLTAGTQKDETADIMSKDRILRIQNSLEKGTYQPRPVRRIYIPKPGKKKMRPIGIPNFDDKVVQDAIRIILNVLYEPEFSKINSNFGFRPKKGCIDAIQKIKENAKGMTYAIEGDIEGAYDNVDFEVAINILKKKIEDKKFLRLIKDMFYAGYIEDPKKELIESEKGVPQGSIVSPTIFNIYTHELDKNIISYLETTFSGLNALEKRKDSKKKSILYERIRSRIRERNKSVSRILNGQKFALLPDADKEEIKKLNKERKEAEKRLRKTKSTAQHLTPLRYLYLRYADDWIIFTNWSKEGNEEIKAHVSDFLERELKLRLSQEKTLITDLRTGSAKFLGFRFKNLQKHMPVKEYVTKKGQHIRRRIAPDIFVGIDTDRVINRFKLRNFITDECKPKRNPLIQLLKPEEIVTKYSQIITGIYNYYYEILTNGGDLGRYHYYLFYSCMHTLAAKSKKTIAQVFAKHGKNIKIDYERYKRLRTGLMEKVWTSIEMPSIESLRRDNEKLRTVHNAQRRLEKKTEEDEEYKSIVQFLRDNRIKVERKTVVESIIDYRLNTRSQRQMVRFCPLCQRPAESKRELESHHLIPLKRVKNKMSEFESMIRNLNTLQVMVCKECHQSIHKGKWANLSFDEYARINEAIKDAQREEPENEKVPN